VTGTIKNIDSSWIVISANKAERDFYYIPMKSVLLIEKYQKQ